MHTEYEKSNLVSENLLESNVFPWEKILNRLKFS